MNWPRSCRDVIPGDLVLNRPNSNGLLSSSTVKMVSSYKYLGIIFYPGLQWTLHDVEVVTNVSFWASRLGSS